MEPITRSEQYLASILGEDVVLPIPQSRIEYYLNAIAQNGIAPSSAGLINYDPDANYPDGSIGKEMHTLDGDVSQLKSEINEVEAGFPQKSASGSIVTIDDGADNVPVVSLTAQIVPVQSGTGDPAPDNVRPISGWTGANINVARKNIINFPDIDAPKTTNTVVAFRKMRWNNNVLSFDIVGAARSSSSNADLVRVHYTDGTDLYGDLTNIRRVSDNATLGSVSWPVTGRFYIKTTKPIDYISLYWRSNSFLNFTAGACKNIMLEVGTTPTEFVPYVNNTVPIAFPDSAGTVYGGSLVLNQDGTADLTVDKAKWSAVGKTHSALSIGTNGSVADFPIDTNAAPISGAGETISAITSVGFIQAGYYYNTTVSRWDGYSSVQGRPGGFSFSQSRKYINIYVMGALTEEAWSAVVADFEVCYAITPVTYHIENVELVKTLYLLNNIWADTGDISLVYRADPATYTAEQIQTMLNAMVAPVEASTTASKAYSVNEFLIYNNVLYKVDSPIANGGTITVGTNVHATTVGAELTAILNS